MKYHNTDFKGALSLLGINQGPVTPEVKAEIRKRQQERQERKEFEAWERRAADEVALFCRVGRSLLANIKDLETLEKYGVHYHMADVYEYHLEILTSGDHRAKEALRNARYYG